ncbi:MAG: septation protein A [Pseudomonadota bacterium]
MKQHESTTKAISEYVPLGIFFITYYVTDLMVATLTLVIATAISIILSYILLRKIPLIALMSATLVGIFGGLTLWFNDPVFIKMKPTIVQLLMGAGLFASVFIGKPVVRYIMGSSLQLDPEGWKKLTIRFACFFWFGALCNEIVWRNFSTELWVTFKVFGIIGLTMGFTLLQWPLLKRHMIDGD